MIFNKGDTCWRNGSYKFTDVKVKYIGLCDLRNGKFKRKMFKIEDTIKHHQKDFTIRLLMIY